MAVRDLPLAQEQHTQHPPDANADFQAWLQSTGLPQRLWMLLLDKLDAAELGCDGALETEHEVGKAAKAQGFAD